MSKKNRTLSLLPVWAAISAVIIIAGIVLAAILNFNYSAEIVNGKTFEVEYDVITEIAEGEVDNLKFICDEALASVGKAQNVRTDESVDSNLYVTVNKKLVYSFSEKTSTESLQAAKAVVEGKVAELIAANEKMAGAEIIVSVREGVTQLSIYSEAIWRGALAILVGAIVALVYVGVRFGVGCALTGLTLCVHDALVTACLLAIFRIPVYFYAPLLLAAIAALVSVVLWMFTCMKMKENFRAPEYANLSAEDAVAQSRKTSLLTVSVLAGVFALAFAILGAVGAIVGAGTALIFFTAILPVAVAVYSSLLLGPALHVPVKTAFDKLKNKRARKQRKSKKTMETES